MKVPVVNCTVTVSVLFKKKERYTLAYCLPFDLMTQGENLKRAERNIREAIEIFTEDIIVNGTVSEVLRNLGRKKDRPANRPRPAPFRNASERNLNITFPFNKFVARDQREVC